MPAARRLLRTQWLPGPPSAVFPFFERPENLARITPPWQRFRILTPSPVPMHVGARIDYRLRVAGLPLSWTTRIETYDPPHGFVDVQLRGPYSLWRHEHRFEAREGGTWMTDCVDYRVPLWPLSELGVARWVERTLDEIFDFRAAAVAEVFGLRPEPA